MGWSVWIMYCGILLDLESNLIHVCILKSGWSSNIGVSHYLCVSSSGETLYANDPCLRFYWSYIISLYVWNIHYSLDPSNSFVYASQYDYDPGIHFLFIYFLMIFLEQKNMACVHEKVAHLFFFLIHIFFLWLF